MGYLLGAPSCQFSPNSFKLPNSAPYIIYLKTDMVDFTLPLADYFLKSPSPLLWGDIEQFDFKQKQYDCIISNEVIADLSTVKLKKSEMEDFSRLSESQKKAVSLIKDFELDTTDAFEEFLFNLGAIELLKTIKKILKSGGRAYLIEYGNEWSYPQAVGLKGHTEYSIHFGFLKKAAECFGLQPNLTSLLEFLPFDKEAKILNDVSWILLSKYLLPFLKRESLPYTVYTEEMIRNKMGRYFDRLSFVSFTHLGCNEVVLDPADFQVLSLISDSKL